MLAGGTRLLCLWTSGQGSAAGAAGGRKRISAERIVLQVGDPLIFGEVLTILS